MDGEFDRELDDGGWASSSGKPWKLLSEQMRVVGVTVSKAAKEREREKVVAEAKDRMCTVVRCAGYKPEDRRSLGELLWRKEKEHASQKEEAARQKCQAGIMKKGTWENEEKKQEQERMAWWRLALFWQGTDHLHREPVGCKGTLPAPENGDMKYKERPPAYSCGEAAPSAPLGPVAHMCPVVTVTSGTTHVWPPPLAQAPPPWTGSRAAPQAGCRELGDSELVDTETGPEGNKGERGSNCRKLVDSEPQEEVVFKTRVRREQREEQGGQSCRRERANSPSGGRAGGGGGPPRWRDVEMVGSLTGVWEDDPPEGIRMAFLEGELSRLEEELKREASSLEDRARVVRMGSESRSEKRHEMTLRSHS